MVTSVEVDANDEVCGVSTFFGITFACKAAVLTTGTFMNGQARAWFGWALTVVPGTAWPCLSSW